MAKHRPPAYLRHKARNLGYSRIDGRQVYFPGHWNSAESLAAYEARTAEWRKSADHEKYPWTIADLAAAYADYAEVQFRKHGEPTRQVANVKAALRLLIQAHRNTLACEMDLPMLKKWRDSLIGKPDRRYKKERRQLSCTGGAEDPSGRRRRH
jgi:hypothetical protein